MMKCFKSHSESQQVRTTCLLIAIIIIVSTAMGIYLHFNVFSDKNKNIDMASNTTTLTAETTKPSTESSSSHTFTQTSISSPATSATSSETYSETTSTETTKSITSTETTREETTILSTVKTTKEYSNKPIFVSDLIDLQINNKFQFI